MLHLSELLQWRAPTRPPAIRAAATWIVYLHDAAASMPFLPVAVESPDPPTCYSSGNYVSGAIHRVIFGAGYEGPLPYNTTIFSRVGEHIYMFIVHYIQGCLIGSCSLLSSTTWVSIDRGLLV